MFFVLESELLYVIKKKTHVLLQQPENKNFFLIPGGRLEIGENIDETIVR